MPDEAGCVSAVVLDPHHLRQSGISPIWDGLQRIIDVSAEGSRRDGMLPGARRRVLLYGTKSVTRVVIHQKRHGRRRSGGMTSVNELSSEVTPTKPGLPPH